MPLITADELAGLLAAPAPAGPGRAAVVVCDVRFHLADHDQGGREYAAGHVPGSRFVDLHRQLADTSRQGAGRHPLPPVGRFAELLGRLGISPSTTVVAYDSAAGATASRLWWMLRSIGHADARVLDGGWQAWVAGGHPVSTEIPAPAPVVYRPAFDTWTGVVGADEVAAELQAGTVVVDSRAPERYRGDSEPLDPRAGHVPGACNVFHAANVGPDGRLLPAAELAARFSGVGPAPIVYCGSGVTACHNLLAMTVAGIDDARLYPGSWSEWSSDPNRPAATGDTP